MESSSSSKEEQKPAKLLERIKRLETENKKLKEKLRWKTGIVDVKEEGTGNSQTEQSGSVQKEICTYKEGLSIMRAVDELRKSLELSLDKISSDMKKMMEDSVDQKYEAEAIAIEKEEKWRREKTELIDEMRRLQQETEEKLEGFSLDNREAGGVLLSVSTAITSLQESVDSISARTGKIEEYVEKQNDEKNKVGKEEIELITGKILILGGEAKPGLFSSTVSDEMFLLNSEKNGWIKLSLKLPKPFTMGGTVYLNGEIHIFGGSLAKETYKLNKNLKWIRLADMNEERGDIINSYLEWNGSIWVFGGWDGKKVLKSVERYDPREDKWYFMTYMKNSRNDTAAAVHNGKFIVCGGHDRWKPLKSVECFDPESGVWMEMNDMPTPLSGHSLVSYGNNLILMGGYDGYTYFNTVLEVSNLEGKGTWKQLPPMRCSRYQFSVANLDNQLFVIGGRSGIFSNLDKTEIFDGERWRDGPLLHYECFNMSSVVGK